MKICILKGSPNTDGSSNLLAKEFIKGAKENNHEIIEIDVAHSKIQGCTGCISCGYEGECILKDDMDEIREIILNSDMIIFVTPLYYYGMSAQLKTLIDRFCSRNSTIQSKHFKSALLTVAWNNDNWTFEALESHYNTLIKYLNLDDLGRVLGYGCGNLTMTKHSKYPKEAYELGKKL